MLLCMCLYMCNVYITLSRVCKHPSIHIFLLLLLCVAAVLISTNIYVMPEYDVDST
jgi:hypothetical protein